MNKIQKIYLRFMPENLREGLYLFFLHLRNKNVKISKWVFNDESFINDWIKNMEQFPDLLKKLKKNLDDESKQVVDEVIGSYLKNPTREIASYMVFTDKAVYSHIFSKDELEEQKYLIDNRNIILKDYGLNQSFPMESVGFVKKFEEFSKTFKLDTGTAIDCGGHNGDTAISILKNNPNLKKVLVFEPLEDSYKKIKSVIENNGVSSRVELVPKAVFDTNGEKSIFFDSTSDAGASLFKAGAAKNKTKETIILTIKIDDYLHTNGATPIELIKMDIEGSETKALQGAYNTICKDKPLLYISIYHSFNDFFNIKTMIEDWDLGYSFKIIKSSCFKVVTDVELICYQSRHLSDK